MTSDKMHALSFSQAKWLVLISYFLALVADTMISLSLLPFMLPSITLLVIFFWVVQLQNQTHLISAFILGLFSDAIFNTALGAHAILFAFLVFLLLRVRLQFKSYPIWQQAFIFSLYFFLFQLIGLFLLQPVFLSQDIWHYWLAPLAYLILWPLLNRLLGGIVFRSAYQQ